MNPKSDPVLFEKELSAVPHRAEGLRESFPSLLDGGLECDGEVDVGLLLPILALLYEVVRRVSLYDFDGVEIDSLHCRVSEDRGGAF